MGGSKKSPSRAYWLRVLVLSLLVYVLFAVSGLILGLGAGVSQENAVSGFLLTGLACLLHASVLSHVIVRSKWHGWPLIVAVFFIYYGIMTFLSQIETVVFLEYLASIVAAEDLPALFAQGVIVAGVFAPVAVAIHGKLAGELEPEAPERPPNSRAISHLTPAEWVKRLALIAVIYVVIYVAFGALVFRPLVGDAFDEYYGDIGLPPWILLLQLGRALIWVALALPILRMFEGSAWEVNLAIAASYAILMGALLLIPTDIMPTTIRLGHFVEVTLSNFVFGWLVGSILQKPSKVRLEPVT